MSQPLEHGIRSIAVVGAGTMGAQIASLIAIHGFPVVLTDAFPDALTKARDRIDNQILDALIDCRAGTVPRNVAEANLSLNPDLDAAVIGVDLVIEAAREDLDVKIELFAKLDRLNPTAIIASNSSSIPTRQMIAKVSNPTRAMNMHFFAPIWIRTMLEIMTCGQTDDSQLIRAQQFGQSLGLVSPIVRTESKGFIINRIWRAVKRESLAVLDEGVAEAEDIDRMFMIFFQTRQAPFAIMDMVGLDVVRDIEWSYQRDTHDPSDKPSPTLLRMIEDGKLGEKSGEGFYTHPNPEYARPRFPANPCWQKGELAMYHVVFLVTRKDGMTQEQFTDYWINQHCPLTAQLPGLRTYRCYPYTTGLLDTNERPPFDAIAFIGFDDEQSAQAALASDQFRTAVADGVNFQDVSQTFGYAAREYVIVE